MEYAECSDGEVSRKGSKFETEPVKMTDLGKDRSSRSEVKL